jgi:glycosyltransferase involved in cell wall biosynthesis
VKSVAIVTPWYGPDSTGGAESLARELSRRLAGAGLRVSVLTTCARSFLDPWDVDAFAPGSSEDDGLTVRRFRVAPRDAVAFDALNAELLALPRDEWDRLRLRDPGVEPFVDESINAPDLERHLREDGAAYDAVLFIPYLYGVTVRGVEALGERAHLIPCLHDEAYARLPRIEAAIHRASSLLFNSDGEAELALRMYGPGILAKSTVIGSGLEAPGAAAAGLPAQLGDAPFVLYLGRRDATKNVDELVRAFEAFRAAAPASDLRLVLAGPGHASYAQADGGIVDLGFVDEGRKRLLLQRAVALVQPSENESYSRVLMEAWREGRPVIAHRDCLATAIAVRESGGGIVAGAREEWVAALQRVATGATACAAMGARGADYARRNSDWPQVIERVLAAIGLAPPPRTRGKRIDQIVATLAFGDAVSDAAIGIRNRLRAQGYASEIWAERIDARVAGEASLFERRAVTAADAVLYHHSIGTGLTQRVAELPVRKAFVYHNVTPPAFYFAYDPAFAGLLEEGLLALADVAGQFDRYVADSDFNAAALRAHGVAAVETIPVPFDAARFDVMPDARVLGDERPGMRWLFVGRVAPNKGLSPLIAAVDAFRRRDSGVRLDIVGRYGPHDPYYAELQAQVEGSGLAAHVAFAGVATNAELTAYYRRADAFVTLSEHEGFCVPAVEAMFFDVPVVALASTVLPETLGAGGLLVEPGADAAEIAALLRCLRIDDGLRASVLEAQRARRTAFLPQRVYAQFERLAAELIA